MANLTVWGIDIGNSAVKAVKMSRNGDQISLDDYQVIPIEHSENDDNRTTRVNDALGKLAAAADFKKNYAYVSIAGNLALFKEFMIDDVSAGKDMKKVIEFEAKQQIAISLDEVEWRHQLYEQDGKKGCMIVAVRKNIINELVEQFNKFNIRLAGITAAPIALTNFIQYEYKPEGAIILLDSGMRSTDFVVLDGKHLFFRPLGIAGKDITLAVMEIFKFDHDKAEDLKKKINSMQPKQAEKIMKKVDPLLRSLASEVHRSIGFYKSKNKGVKIGKLFLFGYTFRLPNMADIIARQVREAPALLIEAPQRLRLGSGIDQKKFDEDFPALPVAVGLGLQGLGEKSIDINLSSMKPPEETADAVNRSKWLAIAGAILLVASLLVGYFTASRAKVLADTLANANKEVKDRQDRREQVKEIFYPKDGTLSVDDELKQQRRLVSISKDSGQFRQIYDQVSTLPVFTPTPSQPIQIKLAHLFISRVPVSLNDAGSNSGGGVRVPAVVPTDPNLQTLYAFLNPVQPDPTLPPELQIDPPLLVVMTVEIFKPENTVLPPGVDPFDKVRDDLLKKGIVRSEKAPWGKAQPGSYRAIPDLTKRDDKYGNYVPEILYLGADGKPVDKPVAPTGSGTAPAVDPAAATDEPKAVTSQAARIGFVYMAPGDNLPPPPAEGDAHPAP
ncbi:MAG TPA: pilus assembly protein PilM [Planctomycetota bacterium]|nr:pilus assembly protein PilM [Planctomycetota bacterium]